MDIYLIRHTQTATPKGLCYGQTDVALADSFDAERTCLSEKLPERQADCAVYSSPLSRCTRLARTFSAHVITDTRLLEINFGDWENQLFDVFDTETVKQWADNFVTVSPPNGESFNDLRIRAASFWQDVATCNARQVFIFTHAGVIRALLAHILNCPPANAFQFKVDVGSIHKLQILNHYTYIHYLNH